MAEDGFTFTPDDRDELRKRLDERQKRDAEFMQQRNTYVETDNPDDAAYDLKKAKELEIPRVAIAGARDEYKAEDTLARMERMNQQAPKTSAWLQVPDNYAVARDDIEGLSLLEKISEAIRKTPAAVGTFVPAMETAISGVAYDSLAAPGLTPIDKAITQNLDKVRGLDEAGQFAGRAAGAVKVPEINTGGFRNPFKRGIRKEVRESVSGAAMDLGGALSRSRATAEEGSRLAAIDADARLKASMPQSSDETVQGYLSGISSLVQLAPTMAAGVATKSPSATLGIMGRQVFGQSIADAAAEGELDPGGAALYAGAQSGIERVTEMLPVNILFGKGNVGKDYLKRYVKSVAAESVTEQAATLGQNFVEWQVKNPEKTADQFIDEMGPAAYQTFVATLVASGAMSGAVLGIEKAVTDSAQRQREAAMSPGEQALNKAFDAAASSKTRTRSPEAFEAYVESLGVEDVTLDLDAITAELEQAGLDPAETLSALGLTEDQLAQAFDIGGEVTVRTSRLLTSDLATEQRKIIQPHTRIATERFTPAQKEKERAGFEAQTKALVEELTASIEEGAQLADSETQVMEAVTQRMEAAALYGDNTATRINATAHAAQVIVLARRLGRDPKEFYDEFGPRIVGSVDGEISTEEIAQGPIRAAAVRIGGKTYTGANHDQAVEAARADGQTVDSLTGEDGAAESGFVDGAGTFVSRADAASSAFLHGQIKDPHYRRTVEARLKKGEAVELPSDVVDFAAGELEQDESSPRGTFNPATNTIRLTEARNLSTFMHESAHWYIDVLTRLAAEPNAHPFVQEQLDTIFKWHGVGPDFRIYDDAGQVTPEGRELHEAFAETFEAYLRTGKAPSSAMREVFRMFKAWMTRIYETLDPLTRANLTPEISAVFDRMLATDQEIDGASREFETQAEKLAQDMLDKGIITEKEFEKAKAKIVGAREAVKEEFMARLMGEYEATVTAQAEAERERIKGDVTREIDRSPAGRALAWLGMGQWKSDVPETRVAEGEAEFYQSIRTAVTQPMEEVTQWVRDNVRASIQTLPSGDENTMLEFGLTEDANAPGVMMAIRLSPKGRADVNLFLDNKMADSLESVQGAAARSRAALDMFSRAIMVMRQYALETDVKAFTFIAAESQGEGTKAKSREDLYRFMLSKLPFEGYTAYEVASQTSIVTEQDGAKVADPLFPSAGFVLVKDGVDPNEFAKNEILRGSQRGKGAGEVVTALTAARLSRPADRGMDGRGSRTGAVDPGGVVSELAQGGKDPKGWGPTSPPPDLPPMRLDMDAVREFYGEEVARKLPAAIKRRSLVGSAADGLATIAQETARALKEKPPKTLSQFIRARGSFKKATVDKPAIKGMNGIKGAADELKRMGMEGLINEKSGTDIDYVREAAEEAGYIRASSPDGRTTVQDLLDAIESESRNEPVYSEQDAADVAAMQSALQWAEFFDERGIDIYERDQKKLVKALSQLVQEGDDLISPDDAAPYFGFNTGEDLIASLVMMGNRQTRIKQETDRRFAQEMGDTFNEGRTREEARLAAHGALQMMASEIELEALARAVGEQASSRAAKQMAQEALATKTVSELKSYRRYLQDERRHGRNAMEAVRKGDMVEALKHKRRQMVTLHMYREAEKLNERIEKARKHLLTYENQKGRRERIAPDYLEKIDAMMEAYELRVSKQAPGVQRRVQSAAQWVLEMTEAGRESEITPEAYMLAATADRKVWKSLTADEVDYLSATIDNLAHLGRTKQGLLNNREKRRFDAVIDEMVTVMDASPQSRTREKSFTPTKLEAADTWLKKVHARLTRMEFLFGLLDGKENGPVWSALFRPMAEAADVESVMMREGAEKMKALYGIFTPMERGRLFHQRVSTPELDVPGKGMTMMDVVVLGLNWGNAGNRAAILDGYGWESAQVEAVLDRVLTDKHWQFIEGVWGLIGEYRDPAFALEKSITGVQPRAVEGINFTLPSGRSISGKYYPLKYDAAQPRASSVVQARLEEKDMLADLGKSFSKPMTKTGHLKERVGSGGKPVKLSIGVFHEHIQNVIHDIAYRPAVIDAHKIISNKRFADSYIKAAGREQYDMLRPWLAGIATERAEEPGGWATEIMRGARRNFSVMTMGYKIGTATQQLTGILAAPTLIGSRYTAQGFLKTFTGHPGSFWGTWQWVSGKSEFMKDRPMGFDRDVRMVTNRMQERTPLGGMQRNAFILIGLMDAAVSTTVWVGAYDKAMDGNVENIDAGNEADAIMYADSVIRRTQVAGRMQDLPQMMRGSELEKMLTMVYSYFSGLYNLSATQFQQLRGGQLNPLAFGANMALLFIVIPMLAEVLAGRFPPGDDEDEPEVKAMKALASNAVSTIPLVRDVFNSVINPQFGYQISPAGSIIEKGTAATAKLATGEAFDTEYGTRQTLDLMGLLFGLPTGQMWITGEYAYDVATGEEEPLEDPADAAREALFRNTR